MVIHHSDDSPNGELNQVLQIINALARKSVSADYIFRGETRCFDEVSSSLYREHAGFRRIEVLQQADLAEARRYTRETDEFAILTELQHYGGRTNLIDFTTDYLIALFFACEGDYTRDGRVVFLETTGEMTDYIHEPRNPASRVLAQKSVFVRPPEGYVVPSDTVIVSHSVKLPMLNYLQKAHNISTETIYNDLHGFIKSKATHRESIAHFNQAVIGLDSGDYQAVIEQCSQALDLNPRMKTAYHTRGAAYYFSGDYDRAIADFGRAIELNPDHVTDYSNRGAAHTMKGDYDRAIADFGRAIELNPDDVGAYSNRGGAYSYKHDFDRAIVDFDLAIELDPDHAAAYVNRGVAYVHKHDFDRAIADFDRAIVLNPNDASAYGNLGEAWLHLAEWGKAKANLLAASTMGEDIVKSFRNDYGNVADFERRTGLTLPDDISEMLGG